MEKVIFLLILLFSSLSQAEFRLYLTGGNAGPETFEAFIKDAGNGHIVILKASDYQWDWYEKNLPKYGQVDLVETLIVDSREIANSELIFQTILRADGVFIAGGNQYKYDQYWKGTKVEDALNQQLQADTPVGGTSAGLAILGEFYYSADPDNPPLKTNFLNAPFLKNFIADTHFSERNRQARLRRFMKNIRRNFNREVRGLGVDEATTLIVSKNGYACVRGKAGVHIFSSTTELSFENGQCFPLSSLKKIQQRNLN